MACGLYHLARGNSLPITMSASLRRHRRTGNRSMRTALLLAAAIVLAFSGSASETRAADQSPAEVRAAMQKAAQYYREKAASHGGYVYFYSADFAQRWG